MPFERVGRLDLPGTGSLDVWWLASYGGGFFIPLRDTTAGRTTYGGGRYLVDTVKGADLGRSADAHWVVDLNFAYTHRVSTIRRGRARSRPTAITSPPPFLWGNSCRTAQEPDRRGETRAR